MAGGYLTPMLLTVGVSFGNKWYSTQTPDIKILLEGGIATALLALANNIPGASGLTTGIAWVAFVAMVIAPIQNPSPAQNLLKIVG